MEATAQIHLKSNSATMNLEWLGFDGDDSFNNFNLIAITGAQIHRFEFGPCSIIGLRKVIRFFTDTTQLTVGFGFRHPDVRHFDLYRSGMDYKLVVRFEGSGLEEEFNISCPLIQIEDKLLKAYDT